MNWLDLFIVLFLIGAVIRGVEIGFIRQFFSTAGFFVGLLCGAWLESKLIHLAHAADTRAFIALTVTLLSALGLMAAGEYAGWVLKFKLTENKIANKIDRVFGGALAGVTLLLGVWMAAAVFRGMPILGWQRQIRTSHIVAVLDSKLPSAPDVLTHLGHLIDPNGFPQVFTGLEPTPLNNAPLPDMGDLNAAVLTDQPSVVKLEGEGCGGVVEGSGFVVGTNEIVTNAHVVAGVSKLVVQDTKGVRSGTVVSFDPDLDLAIVRAGGLAGNPLTLNNQTITSGTPGAVLGYPGGGNFSASAAAVLDSFVATGRNIYNQGQTERNVYSIKSNVQEGNSGGPLIAKDGSVIGVVFAKSTTYDQVGYALTMQAVIHAVDQAKHKTQSVGTGSCAS